MADVLSESRCGDAARRKGPGEEAWVELERWWSRFGGYVFDAIGGGGGVRERSSASDSARDQYY